MTTFCGKVVVKMRRFLYVGLTGQIAAGEVQQRFSEAQERPKEAQERPGESQERAGEAERGPGGVWNTS